MHWQPVRRRSFTPIVLVAAVAAVIGFVVRSAVDQPQAPQSRTVIIRQPDGRQAAAPATTSPQPANGLCSEADGTVRGWAGHNYGGGSSPRDVFGFLPRCDQGGRR
jgi:hypothetical protein